MNVNYFCFAFLITFMLLGGCKNFIEDKTTNTRLKLFNLEEPEMLLDNDVVNNNLVDNEIYTAGAKFIYRYNHVKGGKIKHCYVDKNNYSEKKPRATFLTDTTSNDLIKIDEIVLSVYKGKGDVSLAKSQSIIKYDYFSKGEKIFLGERTGVKEDSTSIFLHPPRGHCFIHTVLYPFPQLKYPLYIGAFWESFFSVPSYMHEDLNMSMPSHKIPSSISIEYEVQDTLTHVSELGNLFCYKINSEGTDMDSIFSSSTFLFNHEYGFIELDYYNTVDSSNIILKLEKVIK